MDVERIKNLLYGCFHDNGNAMIEADKEFMVKKQS